MPAANRQRARRAVSVLVLGLAVALLGAPPVTCQSIPGGTFSLVATHPEAAAYPPIGDSLVGLTPWQGRLYTGYGHWADFVGILDFAIRAYDPATNQLGIRWVTQAEGIWNYRPIGGKLYAPITDVFDAVREATAVGTDAKWAWSRHGSSANSPPRSRRDPHRACAPKRRSALRAWDSCPRAASLRPSPSR